MNASVKCGLSLLAGCFFVGCSFLGDIPSQFRIDRGVDPQHQDEDLRFRTTYYFRVFGVCEEEERTDSSNPSGQIFTKKPSGPYELRNDSLYRFRMTGKSNAFFNSVHFESGTLRAEQIDPFGANVRYDEKTGNFKVISARQSRDESELDAKTKEIEKLLRLRSSLNKVSGGQAELDSILLDKLQHLGDHRQARSYSLQLAALNYMEQAQQAKRKADEAASEALPGYTADPLKSVPDKGTQEANLLNRDTTRDEMNKRFTLASNVSGEAVVNIAAVVARLQNTVKGLERDEQKRAELDKVKERLGLVLMYEKTARNSFLQIEELRQLSTLTVSRLMTRGETTSAAPGHLCSNGQPARRGFQILGPEGFRTFDQDERLLMAFSYNAKPLISLLQELSSRRLSVRADAESLRELATERVRFRDAVYEIEKIRRELEAGDLLNAQLSPEGIIKRVEDQFEGVREQQIPTVTLPKAVRTGADMVEDYKT
jgi:hypothetical protein